jgi:hypothetical protein
MANGMGGDFEAGAMGGDRILGRQDARTHQSHLRTPSTMESPGQATHSLIHSGSRGRSKMESPLHTHSNLPGPVRIEYWLQTTKTNGTPSCPCF